MQLDWSTIVLEVVNFLVLVWLLARFLYRPVLAVVAKRQAAIDQASSHAAQSEARARDLEARYQARLRDWDQERAQALAGLQQEVQAQRRHALEALDASLAAQREKARVLDERRAAEAEARREREALAQGGEFARRLLAKLASAQLEAALVRVAIDEIAALPAGQRDRLRSTLAGMREPGVVSTAFALPPELRERLAAALAGALGDGHQWTFREDASLLAGLRASLGPWVLHFNLAEELELFAEAARDER